MDLKYIYKKMIVNKLKDCFLPKLPKITKKA